MCAVSMITQYYSDKWNKWWPEEWAPTSFVPAHPPTFLDIGEVEALRKEVEDLKGLLKVAKKYDKDNNQPDCEKGDKVEIVKRVAELVGVELEELK